MSAPQDDKFIPNASGTPSSSRAASTPLPEIHFDRLRTTNNSRPNPAELRPLPSTLRGTMSAEAYGALCKREVERFETMDPHDLRPSLVALRENPDKEAENTRLELELEEQKRKTDKVSEDWRLKHRELGALRKQLDVKDEEALEKASDDPWLTKVLQLKRKTRKADLITHFVDMEFCQPFPGLREIAMEEQGIAQDIRQEVEARVEELLAEGHRLLHERSGFVHRKPLEKFTPPSPPRIQLSSGYKLRPSFGRETGAEEDFLGDTEADEDLLGHSVEDEGLQEKTDEERLLEGNLERG
ncbi:MAG: hypothetical protein Q9185_004462 [Variospora sp. 1 TL-2023]